MPLPSAIPGLLILLAVLLNGCASRQPVLTEATVGSTAPDQIELTATPFIPQARYQCGPAALATLLQYSGADASADKLVPQIYLPQRKGSLQIEMLATSRRYNRVPYLIDPDMGALVRALQSGYPVAVLQNLGLATYPLWHYAVVIGYSRADDEIILRSGTEKRKTIPARVFLETWRESKHWGLLLLAPGELPPDPDRQRYLGAVAAMEKTSDPEAVLSAYGAAVQHWPDDSSAHFAMANTLFRLGRPHDAESAYLQVLAIQPDHAAAMNNLAELYAGQGCYRKAIRTIDRAIEIDSPDSPLHATLLQTRQETMRRLSGPDAAACDLREDKDK